MELAPSGGAEQRQARDARRRGDSTPILAPCNVSDMLPASPLSTWDPETVRAVAIAYRRQRRAGQSDSAAYQAALAAYRALHAHVDERQAAETVAGMILEGDLLPNLARDDGAEKGHAHSDHRNLTRRKTMKASALCFQSAVVFVIAGMIWGIIMAISRDFSASPAHAHLNLLGWVSLFLFGIYYRLHPSLEGAKTAIVQVWVWIIGTIIFAIGIGLASTGHAKGDVAAGVGSFIVLLDVLLFGWLVFQGERSGGAVA